ncbi:MAG: hypothetical protein AAF628_28540 [Planctomycetota bacterium]
MNANQEPIDDVLRKIEGTAEKILDGVELGDPDRIEGELSDDCQILRGSLASLMATSEPVRGPADTAAILRECASAAAATAPFPLAGLHVEVDAVPLHVGLNADDLRAAVARVMTIAIGQAGHGGEVTLSVESLDGAAALQVTARTDRGASPQLPSELRCRTLEDFVAGLGGRVTWQDSGGRDLQLTMRLPSRSRT